MLAVLALAFVLGDAPAARAQTARSNGSTTAEAREQFERGARAFEAKDYDEAIARFERAYVLSSAPALLLNIAQAYRLKGSCGQALAFYRRFLVLEPQSPHKAEVETRAAEMRACKEDPATPSPEAEVTPPKSAPAEAPVQEKPHSSPPQPAPPRSEPAASATWTTVGWAGVGVAAVGAGVALTTLGLTLDRKSKLDAACDPSGGCPADQRSRIDEYTTLRAVSIASGIGAALGVGGAILGFWRAGSSNGAGSRPALEAWASPAAIGVRGTFE